jgi:4-hydroxy-tetrahydrodipicolinate synthase
VRAPMQPLDNDQKLELKDIIAVLKRNVAKITEGSNNG